MTGQIKPFECTQPCSNCPYRTDAPVRLWAKEEFADLLANETAQLGVTYGCHKQNGSMCIGWLIDQERRDFPSIMLRIKMSIERVSREYLDSLHSPAPLYRSVNAMVRANFPQLLRKAKLKPGRARG